MEEILSKSTNGFRKAGIASIAAALTLGAGVAGAGAASADEETTLARYAGSDRFATSVDVASNYGAFDEVILANGRTSFADALAANYLSGKRTAPILLTRQDFTPQVIEDYLASSDASKVTIVGGEDVVNGAQERALSEDFDVERISGANRYETNQEIIEAAGNTASNLGLVATGLKFADALAAGPAAYQGAPIGLTKFEDIPDATVQALKDAGVTDIVILGGVDAVSPAVQAELEAKFDSVQRVQGEGRSETSTAFAEYAIQNLGFLETEFNVASGYNAGMGADALSGGPLTGEQNRPMLITKNVDNADHLVSWIAERAEKIDDGAVFGGPDAVSGAVVTALENAAEAPAPASATSLPELTGAQILSTVTADQATPTSPKGTTVRYSFDETIANAGGLGPNVNGFYVYETDGTSITGGTLESVSGSDVTVRFGALDTAEAAAVLTVAAVDDSAVRDSEGNFGPEGDAALGATSGGGTETLPAGITDAPDLVSVGNFRQAATPGETAVDFTFDEAATSNETAGFRLVLLDGSEVVGDTVPNNDTASGGTVAGGSGTTKFTVIFDADTTTNDAGTTSDVLTAADVARGTVDAGTVKDADATANANVLQAADVSNSGNTIEPDLVSVTLRPGAEAGDADEAIFLFDEAVDDTTTPPTATAFNLYDADGTVYSGTTNTGTTPVLVDETNQRQVLVTFASGAADSAVGGNIVDGAVAAADNGAANEQDEVGVANTATAPSQTSGRTAGPDLTGVALATTENVFGTVTGVEATYTFDEGDLTATALTGDFFLYLADGTKLEGTGCAVDTSTADTDNTVVCTYGGPTGDADQALDATLGTVDQGAVTDSGGTANPIGAEFTTGGTGTPQA
jgi:putative cell wall-binding protein